MASEPTTGGLEDLAQGLVHPSALSVGVMLTTAASLCMGAVLLAPHWHQTPLVPYMADSQDDEYLFVTAEARRLRDAGRGKLPRVLLLGASGDRESFSSPQHMQRRLALGGGPRSEVHFLMAGGQEMLESLALAEEAAREGGALILIGVNARRLAESPGRALSRDRLGLEMALFARQSPRLQERHAGDRLYAQRFSKFLFTRLRLLARNLPRGQAHSWRIRRHNVVRQRTRKLKGRALKEIRTAVRNYDRNSARHFRVMADSITRLRALGNEVAFTQTPGHPKLLQNEPWAKLTNRHAKRMMEFAKQHGVTYARHDHQLRLKSKDFADWSHIMIPKVRKLYTRKVAKSIRPVLIRLHRRKATP